MQPNVCKTQIFKYFILFNTVTRHTRGYVIMGDNSEEKKNKRSAINKAGVREFVQSKGIKCSFSVFAPLEKKITEELERAVERAKANKRKTLLDKDLI